jgi:hypothetical protein
MADFKQEQSNETEVKDFFHGVLWNNVD